MCIAKSMVKKDEKYWSAALHKDVERLEYNKGIFENVQRWFHLQQGWKDSNQLGAGKFTIKIY